MSKLVSFAGFSRVAGELKFRTANNVGRIDQLRKLGDTDVVILALPTDMTKNDAIKHVLGELSSGAYMVDIKEAEALLVALVKDENPFKAPAKAKKPKTVKLTVPTTFGLTVQKKSIKVESADDDRPLSAKEAAKIRAKFMAQLKQVYEAN